jgi:hypothetical protein
LSISKIITTYPILFGAFIGLLLLIGIISMVTWAPWIGDAWEKHDKLVQAVFCTTCNFAIFIGTLWGQRRRRVFWPTIFILLLIHAVGVFYYSTYVQPILWWHRPILGMLEFYAAAFLLFSRSARRFSQSGKAGHTSIYQSNLNQSTRVKVQELMHVYEERY